MKDKPKNKNKLYYSIIAFVAIICVIATVLILNKNKDNNQDDKKLAYTELIKLVDEKQIEKIEMTVGSTTVKVIKKGETEEDAKTAIVPSTQAFIELIQQKTLEGNDIILNQKPVNKFIAIGEKLLNFLPTILIMVLFLLVLQMQGLGDKGKVYDAESHKNTNVTFKDVAGLEEEKTELIEIVNFLKEPKKFQDMGAKIPKGILLYGKPGTGKTLIAKAIAGEAGVPFISMSGSEFIEMFAGLGASRVRKLFEKAKKVSPCIVFIDEIDAIGSRRTSDQKC